MTTLKKRSRTWTGAARRRAGGAMLAVALAAGAAGAQTGPGAAPATTGHENPPLTLERTLKIPGVPPGPLSDSMALDLKGRRIFATPQAAKSIAVLDLADGRVLRMITGLGNPHGTAYNANVGRLYVSDGANASVRVYSGKDYSLVKSIAVAPGPDMTAYDPTTQTFYVNSSGEAEGKTVSTVTAVDTVKMEAVWSVALDSPGLEGATVDTARQLLYVTMRDKAKVAVIDLKQRKTVAIWPMPASNLSPWVVALDASRHRLYVACREDTTGTAMHGFVVALDTETGKPVAQVPIGGWSDGIYVDGKRKRLYVSQGVGRVDTFTIDAGDQFTRLAPVHTALMAKTSLFSPDLDRLFVTLPNMGMKDAEIMVLKPQP